MTTPEVRKRTRSFLVGLAALAALGVLGYVMFTANQGRLPGSATTTVTAVFTDVGQADTNSEVRRNGQRIGSVAKIEVRDHHATVTMVLDGTVPIYGNATAAMWDQSALGQKFVELDPGDPSAGPLKGNTIAVTHTEPAHDLSQVLDIFDAPTRAAVRTALQQLGGGAAGYGPALNQFVSVAPRLLTNVGVVAEAASAPQTELPSLLRSGARLASRFDDDTQTIRTLLAQTNATLAAVNVDGTQPLRQSLRQLPGVLDGVDTALNSLHQPLADAQAAMVTLRPGAQALGQATPDLRGMLREAPAPLDKIPGVAKTAVPAIQELTHTLADARPLVPRLADGLSSAAVPLAVLAPYANDIATFGDDMAGAMAPHDGFRHWLRLVLEVPNTSVVSGLGPLGAQPSDPYPAPGQAIRERDPNGGLIPGKGGS
jgi:phospholipid/cholesterol/gamma-HCH transport system substrate-binding protein